MMQTPASDATTPSPQLSASDHDATVSRKRASPDTDVDIDDAVPDFDAFLKQAHYGKLARELRARLSYATFKTSNNVSHLPLTALEQKFGAKPRPTPSASLHQPVAGPSSASSSSNAMSPRNRATSSQLMPPPTTSMTNLSLYSALLGPAPMPPQQPPAKRARYAPPTPSSSQRVMNPLSPQSMPPHSGRSIHNRHKSTGGIGDRTDEISAAATLTSFALKRSGSTSASDGRGSSVHSISRSSSRASVTTFAQTQPTQASQSQTLIPPTARSSFVGAPGVSSSSIGRPKTPQADDATAAELMLFLATSPSPRPSFSSASGHSRTRSETRPGHLPKARVLFGSKDGQSNTPPPTRGSATPTGPGPRLGEAFEGSTGGTPTALLPPASPAARSSQSSSSKDVFDIGDFINTSPFPSQSSIFSQTGVRAEGRNLFGDDDGRNMAGPSRNNSFGMGMGTGGVGPSRQPTDTTGMLGPPLGANV